jgi:hypothetical protein
MKPSEIPGLPLYPAALHLFQEHIDMQFADIRVMMRFPIPPQFVEGVESSSGISVNGDDQRAVGGGV